MTDSTCLKCTGSTSEQADRGFPKRQAFDNELQWSYIKHTTDYYRIRPMKICAECGYQPPNPNARFCGKCGRKLATAPDIRTPQLESNDPYPAASRPNMQHAPIQQIIINQPSAYPKNVGLAIALSLLFGPIGMLYSTISGAIIMFILGLLCLPLTIMTFGLFWIVIDLICVIWAGVAAKHYNDKLLTNQQVMTVH
jgi:hypothetical protein